jgi:hypothetical protein
MMTVEELRERSTMLRAGSRKADDDLVDLIVADVERYRTLLAAELADRLPLMGWLLYEASFQLLQVPRAGFASLPEAQRERDVHAADQIARLADAARALPMPELAPRALGAIRAQALVASKRDTVKGYDEAWILHQEARQRLESFRTVSRTSNSDLALSELLVQLVLAETGTACRVAERVIIQWADGLVAGEWTAGDETRWTQRMFAELSNGSEIGQAALDAVDRVEREHGLVNQVTEHRLAMKTARLNPAIMTARAALLAYPLTQEMDELGRVAPAPYQSWEDLRQHLLDQVRNLYHVIEDSYVGQNRTPATFHNRMLVQLRLQIALIAPGTRLPSAADLPACMRHELLDDDAAEHLSAWLTMEEKGQRNGDASVIGSATMPSYIRSVEACRADAGVFDGYREWRLRWPALDRYAHTSGRQELVAKILQS